MLQDDTFETILSFNDSPGVKLYLITLYYLDNSLTTRDFNLYLNKNLTFQNLEEAFTDLINNGCIEVVPKICDGSKRRAFRLNKERFMEEYSDE